MKKFSLLTLLSFLLFSSIKDGNSQSFCTLGINGTVTNGTGVPLPGVVIQYNAVSGSGTLNGSVTTNLNGNYTITEIVPAPTSIWTFYLIAAGCDTNSTQTVTLTPNNCVWPATANFTLNPCNSGCGSVLTYAPFVPIANQPITFSSVITGNNTLPSNLYLYIDGNLVASNSGGYVSWVPASPGTYAFCLVSHFAGCVDVSCGSLTVIGNNSCNGYAITDLNITQNDSSFFALAFFNPGPYSQGTNFTSQWYLNGNLIPWVGSPDYILGTLPGPGNHVLCLHADWGNGCTADTCVTITYSVPTSCSASITASANPSNNLQYTFTATPDSGSAAITNILWITGDNNNTISVNGNAPVSYTYSNPGAYQVCAVISFANGCSYTACDSILIQPSVNPCNNYQISVNVVPASINANMFYYWINVYNTGGGFPSTVTWILPGSTASGYQGSFTWSTPGIYNICAIATWNNGCTDTTCVSISVSGGTPNGSICGCAQLETNSGIYIPADLGVAYLVQYNPADNTLNALTTTGIVNGSFCFQNLQPGAYMVKAALAPASPYYWNYIPTYYSNVAFWWQATQIVVAPTNSNVNIGCINLIPGINPGGPGFIGGSIFQGANKSAPGDPVPNVVVLLLNMDDEPVAYTYSNHLGEYSFSNLAYGTYKVWPEQAGIPTTPAIVTITPNNPALDNVNIALMSTGFVSVHQVGEMAIDVELWPNPVEDKLYLNVQNTANQRLELSLTDMFGRIILTQLVNTLESNTITLNLEDLTSGIYQVQLKSGNKHSVLRIVKR